MGDTFKLALQLTMIDMLSGVAQGVKAKIRGLGDEAKSVARDFDMMEKHAARGLKALAVASYTVNKMKPGVQAAADLQESLIDVRMSLMRSGKDASVLNRELAGVRATAIDLQKITPFSATDVVNVQKELMNSGLEWGDVVGKGAARAAMMLATITHQSPDAAAASMLSVGIPYHLKGSQYGEVADVIQRHVMSGRMKLPDLNAALPYVAPITKNFKVPWEDMLTGLAVLGEQGQLGSMGGTHLKDFYGRLTGASRISRKVMTAVNQDLKAKGNAPLEFWDKQGELLPTEALIKSLRSSMGKYNTHQKMFILEKIFGEQGGLAAMALMSTGTGSWEFVKGKMKEVASDSEKLTVRLQGFSANVTALGGTTKTTLATMFDPMLNPMTKVLAGLNDIVAKIGELNEERPGLAKASSFGLAGVAGILSGYGVYRLGKAAYYGGKVLKGLRGLPGSALGLSMAEGGANLAAAGGNRVFVTNWPNGFGTGESATAAAGTAARVLPWGVIAGGSVAGALIAAIPVSAALSSAAKSNGWGSRTFGPGTREYSVMGIGSGRSPYKNDIKIDIAIDGQRATSRTNSLDTHTSLTKRGTFFDDLALNGTAY
jgi:TP901 family phage tail tape measure protein